MHRHTTAAGLLLALLSSASTAQELIVKIGHIAPQSGQAALYGKDSAIGARLAVDELNARGLSIGGKRAKFEFLNEDDGGDPKQGTAVAQKLVDSKVSGVVGPLQSGVAVPAAKIFSDAGIPQIAPWATRPAFTRMGYRTAFRLAATDDQVAQALGEHAARVLKLRRIVVIDDRSTYGQTSADTFAQAARSGGAEIVAREYTGDKTTEFSSLVSKVKSANPDLVFFGGLDAQAGPLLRQLDQQGVTTRFMGGDGICSQTLPQLAGGTVRNGQVLCGEATAPGFDMPRSYSYDAVQLLAAAMVKAGSSEPARYLPALARTEGYRGATGPISFDDKGDRKNPVVALFTFQGGARQLLGAAGLASSGSGGGCPKCADDEVCCDNGKAKVCKKKTADKCS
jgi:branched-chain amino acid transport system substrate-binding protein